MSLNIEILIRTKPKAILDPRSLSGHSPSHEKKRIQKGKNAKSPTGNDNKTKISSNL